MSSSWFTRLVLATCVVLLTATAVLWMESDGEEHRSSSMLETVPANGASREFLQARERQRVVDAHREDGSVVVREERALAELPPNAVRIRVMDAEGRGVANIPVGLIDLQAVPLPFFDFVSRWSSHHGPANDEPPVGNEVWVFQQGEARKHLADPFDVDIASSSASASSVVKSEMDAGVIKRVVSPRSVIRVISNIKPESVYFADAFAWRSVTDANGEAIAIWDREVFPIVEASFAFPWRWKSLQPLRAEDSDAPREVTLVLPEIHRARVVGVHDLAVCAEATWHAHLIAKGAGKDGAPIWVSWDPFLLLSAAQDQAREWIWERGLEVEIEAYLDAPFAPVITHDQLVEAEIGDEVTMLRSSDYYAGARGELRQWDGAIAAHAKVQWKQTEWPESGVAQSTFAETSLDAEGKFELVQATSPSAMRLRELMARLEADSTRYGIGSHRIVMNRRSEWHSVRDPELERRETYFDTSTYDPPGSVRDWGLHTFGDGPQLLAGVVRWTDGEPIKHAQVLLPLDWSVAASEKLEAIRTNEQGMFRRLGIPRTEQCELAVLIGGVETPSRFTVEVGRTDLLLEIQRRGSLAGKIVFEAPMKVEVQVQDCGGDAHNGLTDPTGKFMVQGVAVGPVKLSFRAHGVVLSEIEGIVLSSSKVERPDALANVDLSALAYLMTVVLHDDEGEALSQATTIVRDPDGSFRFAAPTNRLAELPIAVPYSVNRLVIASPRYRDLEFQPVAGRLELRLSKER